MENSLIAQIATRISAVQRRIPAMAYPAILALMIMVILPWYLVSRAQQEQDIAIKTPRAMAMPIAPIVQPVILYEKPLFSAERLPLSTILAAQAAADAEMADMGNAASAPPPAPPPALMGIAMNNRGKAVAIIRGQNGQILLKIGQQADGWQLQAIHKNSVTFAMAGQKQTVMLEFPHKNPIGGGDTAQLSEKITE